MRKQLKKTEPDRYYEERTKLWDEQHAASAVEIRKFFESMGGLYNKMAQDWATRDNLLPPSWIKELKGAFENFIPRPWAEVEPAILAGLHSNKPVAPARTGLAAYFDTVDPECLAAASIGQVHCATLSGPARLSKCYFRPPPRHVHVAAAASPRPRRWRPPRDDSAISISRRDEARFR